MSSCDTISSPNNRAISKQRSRRDFRWVNSLSSWTSHRIIPLCCKMRPTDFIGTMHRPLFIHLCATTRGTTHCSTTRQHTAALPDNTLQHYQTTHCSTTRQHTAALPDNTLQHYQTTHCSTTRQHTAALPDNTLQHYQTTHCSTTRQHTAALPDNTLQHYQTTHCSTTRQHTAALPDNTLQHYQTTHCSTTRQHTAALPDNTLQHYQTTHCSTTRQHTAALPDNILQYYQTTHCSTSAVIISDCMKHDIVSMHPFQRYLLNFLKEHFHALPTKIIYFSDGAASQYKNRKNFINLCHHREDFQVCCSETFLYIP